MIHNKENKIQTLLDNFKQVEKSDNCKNVAEYAGLEAQSDSYFFDWLFEADYSGRLTKKQETEFRDFLNELENY